LLKLVIGSQTHIMDVSMSIPDDAFSVNFIGLWVLEQLVFTGPCAFWRL